MPPFFLINSIPTATATVRTKITIAAATVPPVAFGELSVLAAEESSEPAVTEADVSVVWGIAVVSGVVVTASVVTCVAVVIA